MAVVALAIWLGGLAACWMALAPVVHDTPVEVLPAEQKVFAETLRRFSALAETCGVALAALQWVLRRRYQHNKPLFVADGARMLTLFVALFATEYGRYILIPTLKTSQSSAALNSLAGFALAQAVMLIGYAAITVWLQSPALAVGTPATPRPAQAPPTQTIQATKPAAKRRSAR